MTSIAVHGEKDATAPTSGAPTIVELGAALWESPGDAAADKLLPAHPCVQLLAGEFTDTGFSLLIAIDPEREDDGFTDAIVELEDEIATRFRCELETRVVAFSADLVEHLAGSDLWFRKGHAA